MSQSTYLHNDSHLDSVGGHSTLETVAHDSLRETRTPTLLHVLNHSLLSTLVKERIKLTFR